MTKRSQKLFRQWRKNNTGCMRGLISIFDFRQGRSTQRLLSNKRHGGVSNLGISNARNKVDNPCKLEKNHGDNQSDTESDAAFMVNPCVSSISTLLEKEMLRAHHSRMEFSSKDKWIKAEFGTGPTSHSNDKEETKSVPLCDKKITASSNLMFQQSDHPEVSAVLSSELDFSTFMLDYCSSFLELEKTPLEYKIKKSKPLNAHQNQLLGDHPGTKMFQKQKDHFFFRKKEKLTAVYQSNESDDAEALDRIVVLKPTHFGNQNLSGSIAPKDSVSSPCSLQKMEGREQISSHFSLKEIRKRFRNVIGTSRKEEHPIAMDGFLHKIPYGKQITSETENGQKRLDSTGYKENIVFPVSSESIASRKLSTNSASRVLFTEASFCNEARKHLAEFVRYRSKSESLPPIRASKTLGRFLSFPGFNYLSPRHSPAREKDQVVQENSSLLLCRTIEKNDPEHLDLFVQREGFTNDDKKPEFINDIMENIEIEEVGQAVGQSVLISNEDDLANKMFKEEGSSIQLDPEQSDPMFEAATPSTPITSKFSEIQELKGIECFMDDADRPSPISVLEPLFFEEINIPRSTSWRHKATDPKAQTPPRESQIDASAPALGAAEAELDLVSCAEFNEALLFDELEVSYSMLIDDPKLLFDFIDEVLTEIKDRHFSFASRVSFSKTSILPIHKHEYFMTEACRRIEWHLDVQFPNTLEQLVKKDLDGTAWIDLQFGAENTVSKIEDSILDCLFEEIAPELWD